jgi:CheY-like chemotaxis protein
LARKILLADDSVTAQNMGRKILADAGYEVIAVNNGSAALKKIAELKPELVILDVYMPGYSGLEVCQRLKESPETARIPVLLTVGKLEPFKPEEAQRVRAEGYIVKPFEASELLSALSKLEDKIVPRAEPSKPGRFARAVAAAEETDRNDKKESSGADAGWKSRIAAPWKKTGAEEAQPADSAEKSVARAEDRGGSSAGEHVDVAAFAPIGVPKDVSPSEVSAITAAAAQMQIVEAAAKKENQNPGQATFQSPKEFAVEPSQERIQDSDYEIPPNSLSAAGVEQSSKRTEEIEEKLSDAKSGDSQDAPVTMAASSELATTASAQGPRWTAVAVALEGDETSISLDREMQKAYAAFATADYATSAGTVVAEGRSQTEAGAEPSRDIPAAPAKAITEIEISEPEAASSVERVPAISISEQAAIRDCGTVAAEANVAEKHVVEETIIQARVADVAMVEPAAFHETSASSWDPASATDSPVAATVPAIQAATAADARTFELATALPEADALNENSETKPELETVKDTAAAWESWRQIRDTGPGSIRQAVADIQDSATSVSHVSDTAALAVAAGAESALREIPSVPENGNSGDVASIVDSVLAGLRPKLMEEIARKMAEKK